MNRASLLALLLVGCGITETGNPELDASLFLRTTSSEPERIDVDAEPGATSVESVWLSVERLRFVRSDDCDTGVEQEIEAPAEFTTDAADPLPDPIAARLPADGYCRVRMRLDAIDDIGAAPDTLLDHALLVTGERQDGVPFQIRVEDDIDIDIRTATPIALDEANTSLVVAIDLAVWLDGVDLDTATIDGDGVIRVDETSNTALADRIADQIDDAVDLLDDR